MFTFHNQIYFTLFVGLFASLTLASPLRNNGGGLQLPNGKPLPGPVRPVTPRPDHRCPARIEPRTQHIFLGYTGIFGNERLRQFQRQPIASPGGELGAVLYIADSVDLASMFARGPRAEENYICYMFADATEWRHVPKSWVGNHQLGGAGINRFSPGAVLFADHTSAGLPAGAPHFVHQMGIRQAQIGRLRVTAQCSLKSCFTGRHDTLNYRDLSYTWGIQPAPHEDLRKKSESFVKLMEHVERTHKFL